MKALLRYDLVGKGLESYGEALGIKEEEHSEDTKEHAEEKLDKKQTIMAK